MTRRPDALDGQPYIPTSLLIPTTRKRVLQVGAAAGLGILSRFFAPESTFAQARPIDRAFFDEQHLPDPTNHIRTAMVEYREPDIEIVVHTRVGATKGATIASQENQSREDIGGNRERFTQESPILGRPHTEVAEKGPGGKVLFKRAVLAGRGISLSSEEANQKWGFVLGFLTDSATEKFYQARGIPKVDILIRNLVSNNYVIAQAVNRATGETLEMYVSESMPYMKFIEKWGEEFDYVTPKPTVPPPAPAKPEISFPKEQPDPLLFAALKPEEAFFTRAKIGVTTEQEVVKYPNAKTYGYDYVNGRRNKYIRQSDNPFRSHFFEMDEKGKLLFVRRILGYRGAPTLDQFIAAYGQFQAIRPAPFNSRYFSPIDHDTYIWGDQGFALVANHNDRSVIEVDRFPQMPAIEFNRHWGDGADTSAGSRPEGVLFIDGLRSRLDGDVNPKDNTFAPFRDLTPYYEGVFNFSYQGGKIALKENGLPEWFPNPYGPDDTYALQSEVADKLFGTLEQLKPYWPIDIITYSNGGIVLQEYIKKYVLPKDGPYKNSGIKPTRKHIYLHSPIGGVPFEFWTSWIPDKSVSNPATRHLSDLWEDRDVVAAENKSILEALIQKQYGSEIFYNTDDCFGPWQSFHVEGFSKGFSFGRGEGGAVNCDPITIARYGLAVDFAGLGHTQAKDDPGVVGFAERFLKVWEPGPYFGEG